MEVILSQKIPNKFVCDLCHYNTCNKKDFNKHLLTKKHLFNNNGNVEEKITTSFFCECGKKFVTNGGLWKHKQKCENNNIITNNVDITNVQILTNMVFEVVKQNSETQKQNQDLINYMNYLKII